MATASSQGKRPCSPHRCLGAAAPRTAGAGSAIVLVILALLATGWVLWRVGSNDPGPAALSPSGSASEGALNGKQLSGIDPMETPRSVPTESVEQGTSGETEEPGPTAARLQPGWLPEELEVVGFQYPEQFSSYAGASEADRILHALDTLNQAICIQECAKGTAPVPMDSPDHGKLRETPDGLRSISINGRIIQFDANQYPEFDQIRNFLLTAMDLPPGKRVLPNDVHQGILQHGNLALSYLGAQD